MKSVYFRCDANSTIGIGHVMRCLSIADVFYDHGYQPSFILADASAEQVVEERGFHTIILNTNYQEMENELPKLTFLFEADGTNLFPLLFVDSYFTTAEYLQALREHAFVVYIDDVLKYPYPVDVLLNYNIFAEENAYNELYNNTDVRMPELLLGTKYVLLRKQFWNLPKRDAAKKVKSILISTGGADSNHIALQLAECIGRQVFPEEISFHFLLGAMNVDVPELERVASQNTNIILEQNVTDVAGLMTSCDLAVAASGSTLYELCACGVPIINYSFADNQLKIAEEFKELGASEYIGNYSMLKESFSNKVIESINDLCGNQVKRGEMIKRGYFISDGCGVDRVVKQIISFALTFQKNALLIKYKVLRWGGIDNRLEKAIQCFPYWIKQMPLELQRILFSMVLQFDYYSHRNVNSEFKPLYSKLLSTLKGKTIFVNLPKSNEGDDFNSLNSYFLEFCLINNLSNVFFSIAEVKKYLEYHTDVKNLIFVDDFCGSGRTFAGFLVNHSDEFKAYSIYYLIVHAMKNSVPYINKKCFYSQLKVNMIYNHITDNAFKSIVMRREYKVLFYKQSKRLNVSKQYILGYKSSGALVAYYLNTPNDTLGVFWQDINGNRALFPRTRKHGLNDIQKRKRERKSNSIYVNFLKN